MKIFGGRRRSRAERQIKNLARGLFWTSLVLLFACMTMTGAFGWSMGTDLVSKATLAFAFAACDVAGALAWQAAGVSSGRAEVKLSVLATIIGILCFAISLIGIVGFQASNRESMAQGREQARHVSNATLDWMKVTVAEKAVGKDRKDILADGLTAIASAANDQIKRLQTGELSTVADGQATTLARMLRIDEASARSWSTAGASTALLLIQYGCLGMLGFIRQKLEPGISHDEKDPSSEDEPEDRKSPKSRRLTDLRPKTTERAAYEDLKRQLSAGAEIPSQVFLARRWGVSEPTVHSWIKRWGAVKERASVGRRNAITSLNGHTARHGVTAESPPKRAPG